MLMNTYSFLCQLWPRWSNAKQQNCLLKLGLKLSKSHKPALVSFVIGQQKSIYQIKRYLYYEKEDLCTWISIYQ